MSVLRPVTKGFSIIKRVICCVLQYLSQRICQFISWISKKKPLFLSIRSAIPVIIFAYFISASFLTGSKTMQIIGIILQVLAGIMLTLAQIYNNTKIKEFTQRVVEKPHLFAFLITLFVFAIFVIFLFQFANEEINIWQGAFSILGFVSISYMGFISVIFLLNKVFKKWRGNDELIVSGERVSFSLKHVGIIFFTSFILTIGLVLLISLVFKDNVTQFTVLFVLMAFYSFFIFPSLVISMLFICMYLTARVFGYIWKNEKRVTNFWILVFVLWTWGGLLLIMNEIKG
jgi:hypothetical protein